MKSVFWIVVYVLAISVTTQAALMQAIAKMLNLPLSEIGECAENSHLTNVDMSKLEGFYRDGGLDEANIKDFHIDFGCFIACTLEKAGIIQDDRILFERLVQAAERNDYRMDNDIKRKLDQCVEYANLQDDKCRVGLVLATCFLRKLKQ